MNDASNESPTSHAGPRQIYCPRRRELADFSALGGAGGEITVRINTPDSRLRGKFAIFAVPRTNTTAPATAVLTGRGVTIWPYAVEDDQVNGQRGTPVSDVIPGVTAAAPLAIPVHAALAGFGREFITISDGIEVRVTIPAQLAGGTPGKLFIQARYQPVSSVGFIPWQQWDEIRSDLEFVVFGDLVRT